ncbi:MAG TPA: class I SAM-dependent methyltransferase, partial [Armatimonadota bacterium]|nr:class I SAM-dependent methyltransferase [Armatimonadota bacterium]
MDPSLTPTNPQSRVDAELDRWTRLFSGAEYFYGQDAGPVARRAVRYHRAYRPGGGRALDAGCGEGQDLAFLAERGYEATGIEFTAPGAEKARRLLAERG